MRQLRLDGGKGVFDVAGVLPAVAVVGLAGNDDHALELFGAVLRSGHHLRRKTLLHRRGAVGFVIFKGKLAAVGHGVHDQTERIDVGRVVGRLAGAHFGRHKRRILNAALKRGKAAEHIAAAAVEKNILGLEIAVQDVVLFELVENIADLETEVDDLGVGVALEREHIAARNRAVRQQIQRYFVFRRVVVRHCVQIVAHAAQLDDRLDKRRFFVDQIDVFAVVVVAFKAHIGQHALGLGAVLIRLDNVISRVVACVGNRLAHLPRFQLLGQH